MALHALRQLLVHPEQFFETHPPRNLLLPAIGSIFLTAVVTFVGLVVLLNSAAAGGPPEFQRAVNSVLGGFLLLVPIAAFVTWVVLAGVVHLLVRNHTSEATFGRTFALVGIAALLEVPAILIGFVYAYLVFRSTSFSDPQLAAQQLQTATEGQNPLVLLGWIGVRLWQGYVWREGLVGAYDVREDQATLAAGVAVGLGILMAVFG